MTTYTVVTAVVAIDDDHVTGDTFYDALADEVYNSGCGKVLGSSVSNFETIDEVKENHGNILY